MRNEIKSFISLLHLHNHSSGTSMRLSSDCFYEYAIVKNPLRLESFFYYVCCSSIVAFSLFASSLLSAPLLKTETKYHIFYDALEPLHCF